MKSIKYILQTAAVVALASCTAVEQQAVINNGSDGMVTVIKATAPAITYAEGTKSQILDDYRFIWDTDDQLGFIPEKTSIHFPEEAKQIKFKVSEGGSDRCRFTGDGWGLLRNITYYAYFPYSDNATAEKVTVNYSGQCMPENSSTAGLGDYAYLHASVCIIPGETDPEETCEVVFQHLGALVSFDITSIPLKYKNLSFTRIELSSEEDIFAEEVKYNPSQPEVKLDEAEAVMSNSFSIELGEEGSGISADSGNITVNAMMCPADFSGRTINVTLTDNLGGIFTGTFSGNNQKAGQMYIYAPEIEWNLSAVDLSSNETANCYIVSAEGDYKFKATKGYNGENVVAASAGIFWQTYNSNVTPTLLGEVISDVEYRNDGYIYFTKPSNVSGNAIIAAKDGDGKILWTWHIWCVSGLNVITTSQGVNVMDRNLGALTTDVTLVTSAGFNYQWGRKDPFINLADISKQPYSGLGLAATNPADIFPVGFNTHAWLANKPIFTNQSSSTTYNDYVENPTLFCKAESAVSGFNWSGSEKTSTDPCPPGYRVAQSEFIAKNAADVNLFPKAGEISGKSEDGGTGGIPTVGAYGWCSLAAYVWTNDAALNRLQLMNNTYNIDIGENRIMSGGQVRCQKIEE